MPRLGREAGNTTGLTQNDRVHDAARLYHQVISEEGEEIVNHQSSEAAERKKKITIRQIVGLTKRTSKLQRVADVTGLAVSSPELQGILCHVYASEHFGHPGGAARELDRSDFPSASLLTADRQRCQSI